MSVRFHVTNFEWHYIKFRRIYKLEKCSALQNEFNVIDASIISLNVMITPCVRSHQGCTNYIYDTTFHCSIPEWYKNYSQDLASESENNQTVVCNKHW